MPVDLDAILKITSPEQFSEIRIVEHLFHGFLEQGKLKDLLRKFPNYQIVGSCQSKIELALNLV